MGCDSYTRSPTAIVSYTFTMTDNLEIQWNHPDLPLIEHRTVNKELELKRALINIILLLVSKLGYNLVKLVLDKLDFTVDSTLLNRLLLLLQMLFLWNVCSGLYAVLKPQDQFKDLKLTHQQRELLGLEDVLTTSADVESVSEATVKPRTRSQIKKPMAQTATTTSSTIQTPTKQPQPQSHTPIASPMSSAPLPIPSPRKRASPLKPSNADPLKAIKQQLVTPTYIPSPKYHYRMDSPTKSRRRV